MKKHKARKEASLDASRRLDSQSRQNFIDGIDTVGAVCIRDGRVLLAGIVAEQ